MTDEGDWLLVDIACPAGLEDIVSGTLWSLGVAAVEEITNVNGSVTLRTSLGADSAGAVSVVVESHPGVTVTPVTIPRAVADTWRGHAEPTHVTGSVWLVPAWCEPPQGDCVFVEPFDTFGLGNHPTTVGALALALDVCDRGTNVMDLGSGSGVLSVALAALRGSRVHAHDIAAQGERALAHNAGLNGVSGLVGWRGPLDLSDDARYDVIVANILAPVLRELSAHIVRAVRPGGHVVLAGMRAEQVESVVEHFDRCEVIADSERDGWVAVLLQKSQD